MKFLNAVYYKLNLSNAVSFEVSSGSKGKRKMEVRISNKNLKTIFLTYLLFSFVMIFFICLIYLVPNFSSFQIFHQNISNLTNKEDFSDLFVHSKQPFLLNSKETIFIAIIIFIICTAYGLIKRAIILKTKESKPKNINIYNRELPDNLTPAHARLLIYDGLIDSETLASTVLDLIDRGYLNLEIDHREDLFTKNIFISKTNKSQEELFEYEKYLINWFFDTDKISSYDLHKKLNDASTNSSEKFCIFQGLVLLSFPLNKYYKKFYNKTKRIIYTLCFISFFIFAFTLFFIKNKVLFEISIFLPLFGLANWLLASPTYLLNDVGVETKDSYLDLKKFLIDFSLISEKSSEMIILWNYYLSYSVALGIDGKASNEIKAFFGNNIFNVNNQNSNNDEEIQKLIDNIPMEIKCSETLYFNRTN